MNIQFSNFKYTGDKKQIGLQRFSGSVTPLQRDTFKLVNLRLVGSTENQAKLWASCLAKEPNLSAVIEALSGDGINLDEEKEGFPRQTPRLLLKNRVQNAEFIIDSIRNYREADWIAPPSPEGYKVAAIKLILEGLAKKPRAWDLYWALGLKKNHRDVFEDICKQLSKIEPSFPSKKEFKALLVLAKPGDYPAISDILLYKTTRGDHCQLPDWEAVQTIQEMKEQKFKTH